jgi:hypothetical protein
MAKKPVNAPAPAPQQERRALQMHPRLLWDVITKQAGTLQKAILEGAMNTIDAGATRCDITLDRSSFSISDDGKGFKDMAEIENFFETFGYPHDKGDATYGRFRMGRGQMFAFGANRWSSNEFRMDVDLKPQENAITKDGGQLSYDFSAGHAPVKGCRIDVSLYDKLSPSRMDEVVRNLEEWLKWAQIPVSLNGKPISKLPKDEKWDIETDDAYINLRQTGGLRVYNLGVLVTTMSSYSFGTGGTVVSKKQLDVNFARNDIQSSCPVWKRISKHLKATTTEENSKKARLSDSERANLCDQVRVGDLSLADALDLKLLTDVTGTHYALFKLGKMETHSHRISVTERGDRVAETAHNRKLAFVLSKETLERFDTPDAKSFLDMIRELVADQYTENYRDPLYDFARGVKAIQAVERHSFEQIISSRHVELDRKELKPAERLVLKALNKAARDMAWELSRHAGEYFGGMRTQPREVRAGISDTAEAWTDGSAKIWYNRPLLRAAKEGYPGAMRIAAVMLHEYLHGGPDTDTHVHDIEFYERFHNISAHHEVVGYTADRIVQHMLSLIREEENRPTGALLRAEDKATVFAESGFAESRPAALPVEPVPAPASVPERPAKARKAAPADDEDTEPSLPGFAPRAVAAE